MLAQAGRICLPVIEYTKHKSYTANEMQIQKCKPKPEMEFESLPAVLLVALLGHLQGSFPPNASLQLILTGPVQQLPGR